VSSGVRELVGLLVAGGALAAGAAIIRVRIRATRRPPRATDLVVVRGGKNLEGRRVG
jgi:hypothetical protein